MTNYVSYGIHQSFQEYFAALKLKDLFENEFDISEAFSHPKWEEVVLFTSEMMDSVDEFVDLIISKNELSLASKCVERTNYEIKKKLCALLANKMDSTFLQNKINAIENLEMIGKTGISLIIESLGDEDEDVRWAAAKALGNIKSETAVQSLIKALGDEDEDVRWATAKALGNIKSETAVQSLIKALGDEDQFVRWVAVKALGNIKSETAVQSLIKTLGDEDEDVRRAVAKALGNIKSETAVQPLIEALGDEDQSVRRVVAEALGNIKSETAVQSLIKTLGDEGAVPGMAAEALG